MDSNLDNSMIFNKTALHVAVENENTDIINLLLSQKGINTNILSILNHDFFFYIVSIKYFDVISFKNLNRILNILFLIKFETNAF